MERNKERGTWENNDRKRRMDGFEWGGKRERSTNEGHDRLLVLPEHEERCQFSNKTLEEQKTELASLQVPKVIDGAASKLSKIRVVRKKIARGKKCLPTDIRCKKTVRRALTEHETSIKSAKPLAKTRKYS
ncbi:hypothetical protein PRIPAC_93376 [Pristionchus pacificus]|uniref:Large ribosomal subunit protein uL29 n=1 Tax=Pristionchus pacificus TaxID=54126 RepID=A0A2A6CHM6_PRIPA|nr:hypothetical protein PRIPAC_93376 [Pristionchus pacificus]|eukprot:PDM77590.1 ribosomal protein [Pristionchus pacificus]